MNNYLRQLDDFANNKKFPEYLNINQTIECLDFLGFPLLEKEIKFRKDTIEINGENYGPEIEMKKVIGYGNSFVVSRKKLAEYIEGLSSLSVDIDYTDVKKVVEAYDLVLQRSRKYGMRGQRNFTGKIEDEIRGKLVEVGFEKYAKVYSGIDFIIDFELLDETKSKRDKGDFTQIRTQNNEILNLPEDLTFSVKSTAGFFLAVPQIELTWEGNIFILAKLHIKEEFLYKAIKKGLEIGEIDYKERLGWFEIRGYVYKKDFGDKNKSLYENNFPGKYALENKFRQPNFIRTPSMLNRNKSDLLKIFEKIKTIK